MNVFCTLLSFITDSKEITECLKDVDCHFSTCIKSCYVACVKQKNDLDSCHTFNVEILLDFLHDELNTSHWTEVSLDVRRAFQAVSFLKVMNLLKDGVIHVEILKEALKTIDLGLLLGAPLKHNYDLLNKSATFITKEIQSMESETNLRSTEDANAKSKIAKRKYVADDDFDRLQGNNMAVLKCPSLETFNKCYFLPGIPVKLQGTGTLSA